MSTKIEKKQKNRDAIVVETVGYATACINLQIPISERVRVDYESINSAIGSPESEEYKSISKGLGDAVYEAINWFGAQHYWEKDTEIGAPNELFDNCEVFEVIVDDWCVSPQQLRPTFQDEIEAQQIRMKLRKGAA